MVSAECLRAIAGEAVALLGQALVGLRVWTAAYGDWEGGSCRVLEVAPDAGAPEIVFSVRREADGAEIGVFEHERVLVEVHGSAHTRAVG